MTTQKSHYISFAVVPPQGTSCYEELRCHNFSTEGWDGEIRAAEGWGFAIKMPDGSLMELFVHNGKLTLHSNNGDFVTDSDGLAGNYLCFDYVPRPKAKPKAQPEGPSKSQLKKLAKQQAHLALQAKLQAEAAARRASRAAKQQADLDELLAKLLAATKGNG